MDASLKLLMVLRELYRPFSFKDNPQDFFSRFSRLLEKHLNLTSAVLFFRDENGFKSYSSKERNKLPEKDPNFNVLVKKKKVLTSGSKGKTGVRTLYWPILVNAEIAACYVLGLKSGEFQLTNENKILMEMSANRVSDYLSQKHLWENLQVLNRQDNLGWMSAAMVHEIRNPLTALDTLIQLLPQKREDPLFMDSFQKLMNREIGRLSSLTNDLLDFSATGNEKMETVDLNEVIQQVAQLMGPLFYSKKIQLRVKASKGAFLKGDESLLKSLIINLLQNGLKAIGSKGVLEISTRFLAKSAYGSNWVEIRVKDNGKGISPENMGKIFKPFFSEGRLGSGLGLAICQKVVENHKGYLTVKSQLGKGSTFSIFFPSFPIPKKIKILPN